MLFSIIKWYLIIVSTFFVVYYFYYTLTASRRDKIFPSLLEVINHIRETKNDDGCFLHVLTVISLIYGIPSAILALILLVNGKLV